MKAIHEIEFGLSALGCCSRVAALGKLLCYYFFCKFINVEMLGMLANYNKFVMTLSTLKGYLKRLGLKKRVPHEYGKDM